MVRSLTRLPLLLPRLLPVPLMLTLPWGADRRSAAAGKCLRSSRLCLPGLQGIKWLCFG